MLLGGAALTRAYVEQDLAEVYAGEVRYARDAFEGLRLMDALMAARRGSVPAAATPDGRPGPTWPAPSARPRRTPSGPSARPAGAVAADRGRARAAQEAEPRRPGRSDVATDNPVPTPPFWGDRVVKGIQLADYAALLDERATFLGQWGLAAPAAARARRTRSWWRPRGGRGCATGWTGSRPRGSSRRPWSTATSRAVSKGDDLVVLARRRHRAGPVHLPPPAPRPAAVPGRLLPAAGLGRDRRRRLPGRDDGPARSARSPRSCSRPTPTATTWSCTGCRCS